MPAETDADLTTPTGMLRHLLHRNEFGVWSIKVNDNKFAVLPRWMWAYCEKVMETVNAR